MVRHPLQFPMRATTCARLSVGWERRAREAHDMFLQSSVTLTNARTYSAWPQEGPVRTTRVFLRFASDPPNLDHLVVQEAEWPSPRAQHLLGDSGTQG
mmetsp:Transcript_50150/g.95800  ORF Transcript_50150/g.95800 Transcript_50150/m.95800 type:complete len:98 (-) Transcript_50150:902-1195(-)